MYINSSQDRNQCRCLWQSISQCISQRNTEENAAQGCPQGRSQGQQDRLDDLRIADSGPYNTWIRGQNHPGERDHDDQNQNSAQSGYYDFEISHLTNCLMAGGS